MVLEESGMCLAGRLLLLLSSSTSANCCIHCCSAIGYRELGLCKRIEDAGGGLDV